LRAREGAVAKPAAASKLIHTPLPRTESGQDAASLLGTIALLCVGQEVDAVSVLTKSANLLPAAMPVPGASCRIDLMEARFWSSGYREPKVRLERPLNVGGVQVGSVVLGTSEEASSHPFDTSLHEFLTDAAELLSQMLARRADRQLLETQGEELSRRQAALEQMRRLARLGSWEFDASTSRFMWSDEARRIAGLEADAETTLQREELLGAFLRIAIDEAIPTRKQVLCELPCLQPDGTKKWLYAVGEVEVADARLVRAFGIVRDVTDEKETQTRLSRLANHDPLTGLPNRRQLLAKIEAGLLQPGAAGALLLIDLDNFKDVNDSSGHDAGDALLKAFARRLEIEAGRPGFVARLGGDEFVVLLLCHIEKNVAKRWAEGLLSTLREPFAVDGFLTSVRISAGLTVFPAEGNGAAEILKNADLAVYAAKARGRNLLVNYDASLREETRRRLALCAEVKDGLNTSQIVPFYQPKVCLRTGQLVGFEALLRWDHASGLRTPGAMRPAFDLPELSRALCSRMLEQIISDMADWQKRDLPFGRVAFNASSSEFSGFDLVGRVLGQLEACAVPPSCLGLEVTETVFLGGGSDAIGPTLEQLHKAGLEIALDDFGTGYASLTHLQQYPVDVIKIDQSFIRGLITEPASQAITSVVLGLGRSLGMKVVAEGVETAEQASRLMEAGCDQVQGYFFARPMPARDVPDFVTGWRGADAIGSLASVNLRSIAA